MRHALTLTDCSHMVVLGDYNRYVETVECGYVLFTDPRFKEDDNSILYKLALEIICLRAFLRFCHT